jgi:hypothetical protein
VGTKVDKLAGSWEEHAWGRDAAVSKKLKAVEDDMRTVVANCCGAAALDITSFLFVTAVGAHPRYSLLREELMRCLKLSCRSIFQGDPQLLKTLRFPAEYRRFQTDIKKLDELRPGLPVLELESVIGAEYGILAGSHTNAQGLQALQVLHDVGDIIFCHVSGTNGGSKACLCWHPQVVADVIAKFADPDSRLPMQRGCSSRGNLEAILLQYLQESPYRQSSAQKLHDDSKMLFNFLLTIRVFAPVERPNAIGASASSDAADDSGTEFMVPSSLQGRPSFWREVFDSEALSFSCIRGVRCFSMDPMITVAAFVRAMTRMCSDPARMWGCAFSVPLRNGGLIFVRLAESRDFVDVVVLGSDLSQLTDECVDSSCREISTLLRCSSSDTRFLCPHCCASDMFARSGAVHAFYREQLTQRSGTDEQRQVLLGSGDELVQALHNITDTHGHDPLVSECSAALAGGMLESSRGEDTARTISCSRYHEVTASCVLMGQDVGLVGGAGMPASFQEGSEADRDAVAWVSVSRTGFILNASGSAEVAPGSFFSLSRQLDEGDEISAESLVAIDDALQSGAKSCHLQRCGTETDGEWLDIVVCLEYTVGDTIGGKVIEMILSCFGTVEIKNAHAGSGSVVTKQPHQLRRGDQVMLSVPVDSDGLKVEGIMCAVADVPKEDQLVIVRMQSDSAAVLPLEAGVAIMPVCASFTPLDNVLVVYRRVDATNRKKPYDVFPGSSNDLRILRLVPGDCARSAEAACWRDVEDNWAVMLGNEFCNYEITAITRFRCEERDRLFLRELRYLKRVAPHRPPPDFTCATDRSEAEKAQRAALQQQVMGHFNDFSQKFSLLPTTESKDVNMCVAWWGKAPSAYFGAARNGFWNLPSHLKIDPGWFGKGFYLTRYPRYSDFYINGFSLSQRRVERGSILMCYAALGRPYPVTQDPFSAPDYRRANPSSPCGKACGAACNFSSSGGIDAHDCHYVTVAKHPDCGQYFPCPARQHPDFDEIVMFNPDRVLASACVTFQRRCGSAFSAFRIECTTSRRIYRRKTLMWLDDNPNSPDNTRIRCKIPGHSSFKALEGLGEGRLSLVAENDDVALEDQVDVTLFTTVDAMVAFMSQPSQQKFAKYPASLFRIITNRRLFVGPSGLHSRVSRLAKWSSAFPAILVFHGGRSDGLEEFAGYPNLTISQRASDCEAFVSFQAAKAAATRVPETSLGIAADQGVAMDVQGVRQTSSVTGADDEAARRIFQTGNRRDLCLRLKEADLDFHDLKYCGFDAADLKFAGFSASELKSGGFDATTLLSAGYDMFAISVAGFSTEQLAQAGLPTNKCIVFNGYVYKTLGNHDPRSTSLIYEFGKLYKLEPGWKISPATPDALHVCAAYPWAAHALVLADENVHCTALGPSVEKTLSTIDKPRIYKSGDMYGVKQGWPTHSVDVLVCRKLFCGIDAAAELCTLKTRGFSAFELSFEGFDASSLLSAGFSGPELLSAGCDAASLISAASSLNVSLAILGLSSEQLEKAGLPTDKCIIFNGYIYKTLGDHDPSSVHLVDEFGKLYKLEPGWDISPATPDALHVCAAYPWAAHALVLADESEYCTALAVSPGSKAASNRLVREGEKIRTSVGLLSHHFVDVLIFRKFLCKFRSQESIVFEAVDLVLGF